MKRVMTLALAAVAPATLGDTISQTVGFSHGFDGEIVAFERFDTQGGTRVLTGMSLTYDHSISMDVLVESNGYTSVSAGDWFVDAAYNSLHQFGLVDNDPDPPFIGPGSVFGSVTGDLGVSDGYNGSGPDTYSTTISDSFVFFAEYDASTIFGQDMLETFTGVGALETFFSGFTEFFGGWINDPNWVVDPNNPPDGPFLPWEDPYHGFFLTISDLVHAGEITVVYEYANVPTPGAGVVLGLAGLGMCRRRR